MRQEQLLQPVHLDKMDAMGALVEMRLREQHTLEVREEQDLPEERELPDLQED